MPVSNTAIPMRGNQYVPNRTSKDSFGTGRATGGGGGAEVGGGLAMTGGATGAGGSVWVIGGGG